MNLAGLYRAGFAYSYFIWPCNADPGDWASQVATPMPGDWALSERRTLILGHLKRSMAGMKNNLSCIMIVCIPIGYVLDCLHRSHGYPESWSTKCFLVGTRGSLKLEVSDSMRPWQD
jgi:hypothetical protein